MGVPPAYLRGIHVIPIINPQEIIISLQTETAEIQSYGRLFWATDHPYLALVVAIVAMVETTFRSFKDGDRCAFIDELVVIVPIPIRPRVGMRLVGIMLVTADFGAGIFASEIMDTIVETGAVVKGVTIKGAMSVDGGNTGADVTHQIG